MLKGILFKDKRFETKDDNNLLCGIAGDIIVLCKNKIIMDTFAKEIINTINDKTDNDYCCSEEDVGKAKMELAFGLQRVIDINGQKIFLCLEPAMVYKAKQIEDIWFLDCSGSGDDYKEQIYPMTVFKGSRQVWDEGLDKVYRTIITGAYGCYNFWIR